MHNSPSDSANALTAGIAALGFLWAIVCFALLILGLVINWKIASKAGYSGALSLLMLVPLVNLVVLLVFAFAEWPVERALQESRQSAIR